MLKKLKKFFAFGEIRGSVWWISPDRRWTLTTTQKFQKLFWKIFCHLIFWKVFTPDRFHNRYFFLGSWSQFYFYNWWTRNSMCKPDICFKNYAKILYRLVWKCWKTFWKSIKNIWNNKNKIYRRNCGKHQYLLWIFWWVLSTSRNRK